MPIDVLKAEFPAEMEYEEDQGHLFYLCQQLNEASRVPWVILSAGVNFEVFCRQVEIACKAGASGFLAGRTLWQESTCIASRTQRLRFLETGVAQRLDRLANIANTYGTPWYLKLKNDHKFWSYCRDSLREREYNQPRAKKQCVGSGRRDMTSR